MISGGRPRPELPRLSPSRAPRLRRIARFIEEQADRSRNPAGAKALACQMRLRAAEIEAGSQSEDELEDATKLVRELEFDTDE